MALEKLENPMLWRKQKKIQMFPQWSHNQFLFIIFFSFQHIFVPVIEYRKLRSVIEEYGAIASSVFWSWYVWRFRFLCIWIVKQLLGRFNYQLEWWCWRCKSLNCLSTISLRICRIFPIVSYRTLSSMSRKWWDSMKFSLTSAKVQNSHVSHQTDSESRSSRMAMIFSALIKWLNCLKTSNGPSPPKSFVLMEANRQDGAEFLKHLS